MPPIAPPHTDSTFATRSASRATVSDTDRPLPDLGDRYRAVRLVGEGGMGQVFEAEQRHPVRRTVAVKLLRADYHIPGGAARFEVERQAVARMDHPHIARLLDAGTAPDGRPFFVMEFVPGVPVTRYCEARQLPARRRLELFAAVCQAVQHAHQKGVLHRDLKPGNILVEERDGAAVPKVIDFGLAKEVGLPPGAELTTAGQLLGTLLYMAPEQLDRAADADTRADIYALGAVLYELLVGRPPIDRTAFELADLDGRLRLVREQEPARPGELVPGLDADLDWIALKALDKDPDHRYPTAAALAADVRRHLADQPVEACPPSELRRVRKFVRRNRAAVVTVTAVLLAAAAGVAGTVTGLLRAKAAESTALDALTASDAAHAVTAAALDAAERDRGALKAEQAKTAAALAAAKAAHDRATEALTALTDGVIDDLFSRRPSLSDEDRAFLRKLADAYEKTAPGDGPDADTLRMAALVRVAGMRSRAGDRADGEKAYRQAAAVADKLLAAPAPSEEARAAAGHAYYRMGVLLLTQDRSAEAVGYARRAVALRDELAAAAPADPARAVRAAEARLRLGSALWFDRQEDAGTAETRRGLADLERLAAAGRTGQEVRFLVAEAHSSLGVRAAAHKRPADALAAFTAAADRYAGLLAEMPEKSLVRSKVGRTRVNQAVMLHQLGRPAEAERAMANGVAALSAAVADQPGYLDHRVNLGGALAGLAAQRAWAGDLAGARTAAEAAVAHLELVTVLDPRNAAGRTHLARALARRAEDRERAENWAAAVADWRRAAEVAPASELTGCRSGLAAALARGGKPAEAAGVVDELLARPTVSPALRAACGYVLALCGEQYEPRAAAELRAAASAGHRAYWVLATEPRLAGFRRRPEVAALLSATGPHREDAPAPRPAVR